MILRRESDLSFLVCLRYIGSKGSTRVPVHLAYTLICLCSTRVSAICASMGLCARRSLQYTRMHLRMHVDARVYIIALYYGCACTRAHRIHRVTSCARMFSLSLSSENFIQLLYVLTYKHRKNTVLRSIYAHCEECLNLPVSEKEIIFTQFFGQFSEQK